MAVMFSQRHYESIAACCRQYRDYAASFATRRQRLAWHQEFENRLADLFVQDNPKFDRGRFFAACLPESYKDK